MSELFRNGFHAKEGLFFKRNNNGNILVILDNGSTSPQVIELNPDTWASAVASVSVHGDTAEAFAHALDFYNGEV